MFTCVLPRLIAIGTSFTHNTLYRRADPIIVLAHFYDDADSGIFPMNQNVRSGFIRGLRDERIAQFTREIRPYEGTDVIQNVEHHQSYIEEGGLAKIHHRTQRRLGQM